MRCTDRWIGGRRGREGKQVFSTQGIYLTHLSPSIPSARLALLCVNCLGVSVPLDQKSYISNYLESFQRALWGPQFSHPTEGYAKYIDVDSFVDYFLHTESTKNLDGYISSVYLSKDEGGKLTAGPAWDYNLAYGQATYWDGYYREPWGFTHVGPNQKRYSQMVHWYYR